MYPLLCKSDSGSGRKRKVPESQLGSFYKPIDGSSDTTDGRLGRATYGCATRRAVVAFMSCA